MSFVLNYHEHYKIPAGLLALSVHAAFFAVLMIGLRWQTLPHENFSVELWDTLPAIAPIPEPLPAPPPPPVPPPVVTPVPPQPVKAAALPPSKAEIELREKKASKVKLAQPVKPAKPSAKELKELKAKRQAEEQRLLEEYTENRRNNEQARVREEVNAAIAAEVGRYQDMIRSKIRRNIVMPPDVPENAVAEFKVTLLPGGMVMEPVLLKSSGNAAYDNAAERAIYKAQPLPVPADAGMQKMFRELRLIIRPEE